MLRAPSLRSLRACCCTRLGRRTRMLPRRHKGFDQSSYLLCDRGSHASTPRHHARSSRPTFNDRVSHDPVGTTYGTGFALDLDGTAISRHRKHVVPVRLGRICSNL